MKHKHERFIKLMADGVRIERKVPSGWVEVNWGVFVWTDAEFRIAPNQPADEEGWIRWFGGENPVPGKMVEYKGPTATGSNWPSENLVWRHCGSDGDITHYRVVKDKVKQKVKKWRWMFFYPAPIQASPIYVSEPFTEDEAAKYFADPVRQRVVPEWKMEVECDGL
jgi:hypothetical protein